MYRELINLLRHVGKGHNLLFIMPRFRGTSTYPWIVSAAIKTKWTIDICFRSFTLVYGRIFLRFSRVFLFWMAKWKHKGRTQYLFHVRFQSWVKLV